MHLNLPHYLLLMKAQFAISIAQHSIFHIDESTSNINHGFSNGQLFDVNLVIDIFMNFPLHKICIVNRIESFKISDMEQKYTLCFNKYKNNGFNHFHVFMINIVKYDRKLLDLFMNMQLIM